jgi:hypothetical protein
VWVSGPGLAAGYLVPMVPGGPAAAAAQLVQRRFQRLAVHPATRSTTPAQAGAVAGSTGLLAPAAAEQLGARLWFNTGDTGCLDTAGRGCALVGCLVSLPLHDACMAQHSVHTSLNAVHSHEVLKWAKCTRIGRCKHITPQHAMSFAQMDCICWLRLLVRCDAPWFTPRSSGQGAGGAGGPGGGGAVPSAAAWRLRGCSVRCCTPRQ